jgi:exopolyphosphatase/pppGpp-phosphohydrolase
MDNWPCDTLRVADRGLREGMLIALVRESESPARTSAKVN